MKTLQILSNKEFGQVRAIEIDSKMYFGATDVAKVLGYVNPTDAIIRHCREDGVVNHEVGVVTGKKKDGSDSLQYVNMKFITEGNLYRLIARSKLPSAEKFENWIFDEVLPSIRENGGYISDDTILEQVEKLVNKWEVKSKYLTEEIHDRKSIRTFIRGYDRMKLDECIKAIEEIVTPMKGDIKHNLIDVAVKELKAIDKSLVRDNPKLTYIKDCAIEGVIELQGIKIGKQKQRIATLEL